jgi:hypothetical protein
MVAGGAPVTGSMVEIALALAASGRRVYPMRYDRKISLTSIAPTTGPHQIRAWWDRWPSARVGVAK